MIKYTTLCLLAILLSSCNTQRAKNDVPMLTVTMEPQRYFTEAIAGDKFNVTSMVPKGSNPETYDPTPSQLVAWSDSKAYLRIGNIGFDAKGDVKIFSYVVYRWHKNGSKTEAK